MRPYAEPDQHQIAEEVVDDLLGRLDGTITRNEALNIGLVFVLCCGIAVILTLALWVTGTPFGDAKQAGRSIVIIIAIACVLRAVMDILALGRALAGLLDGFWDWLDRRDERATDNPPSLHISIAVTDESGRAVKFLNFEGTQAERVARFARMFLELDASEAVDYPTAEDYYVGPVRDGKIWTRGKTSDAGYPGWQSLKAELIGAGMAYAEGNRWHIKESGKRALRKLVDRVDEEGL